MTYTQFTNSAPVVMAEFYATWCPHCKRMQPVVEQISELTEGQAVIQQFDVDEYQSLSEDLHISGTPTFIIYRNGTEQWRHAGEIDGRVLLSEIEKQVKSADR